MNLKIRLTHNSGGRRLPKPVLDYIRKRFLLKPEYMKNLRCFEYAGTVHEKSVQRFKIFDSAEVRQKHLTIRNLQELEQHPEHILFEGYIDHDNIAYAADRRVPVRSGKKKTPEK